jgi:integrase
MSLIGQKTTSEFIDWDKLQSLTQKLERDGDWKFCLLITIGMYTGLRIGDLTHIRWSQILNREYLELQEKKTGKTRKILLNQNLRETLTRITKRVNPQNLDDFIFLNRMGTKPISRQFVNGKLKRLVVKYQTVKNPSSVKSHSIRKSFGRRVWENSEKSEKGLIMLNEIFNHTSIKTTRIYLGITQQEVFSVYENL